jgi:enoyl-CoA hydratase/carnithine racemase
VPISESPDATALSWGLVNRVVPEGELDAEIRRFTEIVLSRSSAAIRCGKQSFYGQIDRPLEAAYGVASKAMACNMLLEDAAEGMDASLQKRPAKWRGK